MPQLTIVARDGSETTIEGQAGLSVMEVIRDNGFDELLALCGGCCSCATCHVHVDEDWLDALPPMDRDEDHLLDSSDYKQANSRLSCQIPFSEALAGLRVAIAPED
ncbi:2Fe-2S iron-sulfur cluster-binding protein [Allosphingosinicella sp.]|uniref:2Fe-2S iron-sulfur cluster-binding protein n=1 Tax=Allosphingosinicella sp. TaxID=2823234 RepID=UPI002FC1B73B